MSAAFGAALATAAIAVAAQVTTGGIANGAITTVKLAPNAVTASKIANGTIGGPDIGTNAVGADEVRGNAIGTTEIDNLSIAASDLAAQAVTSPKIADGTIQAGDLAPGVGDVGPVTVMTNPQSFAASETKADIDIDCPAGMTVISGGWRNTNNTPNGPIMIGSYRDDADTWTFGMRNGSGSVVEMMFEAYCV